MKDNTLIICPNDTKMDMLLKNNSLCNIKFMDINEFINNYYFSYDYKTIDYVMTKYNVSYDIAEVYIKSIYAIDIDKYYSFDKLNFLKELKNDLINNNLLIFNSGFKEYLKSKNVEVINYPKLEKYIIDDLKIYNANFHSKELIDKKFDITRCNTMYDEIVNVCKRIIDLKRNGVSLNNIFIIGYSSDYYYLINKVFDDFNINIDLEHKCNLLSSSLVKKYIVTNKLPDVNENNSFVVKKIVDTENKLVSIKNSINHKSIFKHILKNVSIKNKFSESVKITNLFDRDFSSDQYVFLIGFNYDVVPTIYKDEDYITDSVKSEINLFTTREKNTLEKEITVSYLSNIPNLYISYKLNDYNSVYYKSNLLDDYDYQEYEYSDDKFDYSNKYNKRYLAVSLDNYYKYNISNKNIDLLYNKYKNIYNTYDNKFTGIDSNTYLNNIEKILLSYTSMNSYNLCGFKYYVNYVLKVDSFEENFITLIGNLFHYVLEHSYDSDFRYDVYFDGYLKDKDLSIKEIYLINKLKGILEKEIEIIKDNDKLTSFHDRLFERSVTIPIKNSLVESYFTGKIDKILYHKEINNTYFSIIDYKTGSFDSNLNNMKYGIGMQLATYLYLIIKGEIFESPIFAGMYFQKVLLGNVSYDGRKSYLDKLKDNLKLVGYSTDNVDVLEEFDHTYENSSLIHSMKTTEKGFSRYSKVLSDEDVFNIFKYTENIINDTLINISNAKFDINPKKVGGKDLACKYCKYRDLCYKKEDDYINLSQVDNLDFLGGDINA